MKRNYLTRIFKIGFLAIILLTGFACNTEKDELFLQNNDSTFNNLDEDVANQLLNFFGVSGYDDLQVIEFESETKSYPNQSIIVIIDEQYSDFIEEAPQAAYLKSDETDYELMYFWERNYDNELSIINIYDEFDEEPSWSLVVDVEKEYFEVIIHEANKEQTDFEFCVDVCIEESLNTIQESHWTTQVFFYLNLAPSFAEIVVTCTAQCLGL